MTLPSYLTEKPDGSICYWTGARKLVAPGECDYCDRLREAHGPGGFFPDHDAMPGCRSGARPHCTCDGCF